MPKGFRTCTSCGLSVHIKKKSCNCGYLFGQKNKVKMSPATKGKNIKAAPIENNSETKLIQRIEELQNHISVLEKQVEKRTEEWRNSCAQIEKKFAKWYNRQAELIYERAYRFFGGQSDKLYHDPIYGGKPLFKDMADETGIFNAESMDSFASTEEPSEAQMVETIGLVNNLREPVERDLEFDGVVIDDAMSIDYASFKKQPTPSLACAVAKVKCLVEHINNLERNEVQ